MTKATDDWLIRDGKNARRDTNHNPHGGGFQSIAECIQLGGGGRAEGVGRARCRRRREAKFGNLDVTEALGGDYDDTKTNQ